MWFLLTAGVLWCLFVVWGGQCWNILNECVCTLVLWCHAEECGQLYRVAVAFLAFCLWFMTDSLVIWCLASLPVSLVSDRAVLWLKEWSTFKWPWLFSCVVVWYQPLNHTEHNLTHSSHIIIWKLLHSFIHPFMSLHCAPNKIKSFTRAHQDLVSNRQLPLNCCVIFLLISFSERNREVILFYLLCWCERGEVGITVRRFPHSNSTSKSVTACKHNILTLFSQSVPLSRHAKSQTSKT